MQTKFPRSGIHNPSAKPEIQNVKYYWRFNQFQVNTLISYPLKTPENLCFSGVFSG